MQFNALMTLEQRHRREEKYLKRSNKAMEENNDFEDTQRKFINVDTNSDLFNALRTINRTNPSMFQALSASTLANLGYQAVPPDGGRVVAASGQLLRGNMNQIVNGRYQSAPIPLPTRVGHNRDNLSRQRERCSSQGEPLSPISMNGPGVVPLTPQNQVRLYVTTHFSMSPPQNSIILSQSRVAVTPTSDRSDSALAILDAVRDMTTSLEDTVGNSTLSEKNVILPRIDQVL